MNFDIWNVYDIFYMSQLRQSSSHFWREFNFTSLQLKITDDSKFR